MLMRWSTFAFVLCGTVAFLTRPGSGAPAADHSLGAVFQRMDEAAAKFKGLKAEVKKVAHVDVINDDTIDTGTIVVRSSKPHELIMLIDFKQPDPKMVRMA